MDAQEEEESSAPEEESSAQEEEYSISSLDPYLPTRRPSSEKKFTTPVSLMAVRRTSSAKTFTSPEPAMYRPRPSSQRTQDISHLLTSIFKNLYTGEVIGKDKGQHFLTSRGGDNAYHEKFVDELEKIRCEHDRCMAEADMVERHIIQARARATAEEERALNRAIEEAGGRTDTVSLPPVDSYFRWCVDNDLLRKHHLICPEDYLPTKPSISKPPEGSSRPHFLQETFSFHKHVSTSPVDDGYREISIPDEVALSPLKTSTAKMITCTLQDSNELLKKSDKKRGSHKKMPLKNDMSMGDREEIRTNLACLENRHNFLKNPRFFPPNTLHGGRSLIAPIKKTEKMVKGGKRVLDGSDPCQPVPVFLANPPIIFFSEYEVGQVYEMTVELRNLTAVSRYVRIIPPSTPYFAVGLGKFPGEGGMVAPGMSCHYTVRFVPHSLADFEDFILVETQAPYPLLVPIEARRPPPALHLPRILDCGACLAGGIKILEMICTNEGLSRGRFCIMPKKAWPPPNFRSVATAGFVEQSPFGIRPAVFQLYPGQSTLVEVVFFPTSAETFQQTFTIVCDNCQVQDLTIVGFGQLLALELVSVIGGESNPGPGELVDVIAEHRLRFSSLNPFSTSEKKLLIRNSTHVPLPFVWQVMKPNLQPLLPGESYDPEKISYYQDTETAFSILPSQGVLEPFQELWFVLTYAPKELKNFHSVLHMIVSDIPEPPRPEKQGLPLAQLEPAINDVIVLDVEVKGTTEPFNILLEPYAIIIPGVNFIGSTIRKQFKMWNNSKAPISFEWEKITDCHIIQVEPYTGNLGVNGACLLEMSFTGGRNGFTSQKLQCKIQHALEPVMLLVEATFKGPVVSINAPSLDLGLIKLGDKTLSTFQIENMSQLPAKWRMQESSSCLAERNEDVSQFSVHPPCGELTPLGSETVSVLFKALSCQRLQTVLELEVENGDGSYIAVTADVQNPQVCLISSQLVFNDIYIGIPSQATVKLFNQGLLPATYSWGELCGSHSIYCSASVSPSSGVLGPNEETEVCVELTAHTLDELNDLTLSCDVEGMSEALVLFLSGQAEGLQVTYSLPGSATATAMVLFSSNPHDLLLDFGSEVALQSTVTCQLVLTNHTSISASFMLEVTYFSGSPQASSKPVSSHSASSLLKKSPQLAAFTASKAQTDFAASCLSDGKGAAFFVQPATGVIGPFQQLIVDVSAFSSMWGDYQDELVCKVGDLPPMIIPMRMSVKGCPIYFQITGPQPKSPSVGPRIRFGTHISGGDTISRCLRINNPSPFDIQLDWEIYNLEKDDRKLIDLLVFYGDPFPLKDMDGNEIIGSRICDITERDAPSLGWDHIPSTSSTTSSAFSQETDYHSEDYEDEEEDSEGQGSAEERSQETKNKKLISVILRAHEGVSSDYPFCITPRQIVLPARGSGSIHISFTPLMLTEAINKIECSGFALGFMSLDSKVAQRIPGKVERAQGFALEPIRLDLQGFVKPALLTINMEDDDDEGLVFYSVASDLIPNEPMCGILTETITTRMLKLINATETPLFFRLLLSRPFTVSGFEPNKSLKTSHSDRDEQGQLVLYPQQNMMVKVSFCTTLELLTYQNLPADQMLPGTELRMSENGEKKLIFYQQLVLEYSNKAKQELPLCAYLSVPVLQLSHEIVDFGACYVGQTQTREVFLLNRSGSKSYWTALIDEQERHSQQETFSLCPTRGVLEAHVAHVSASKEALLISFTARDACQYETKVTIHGMLGEQPCSLRIQGQGSYDEKYEDLLNL
ncbi:deleted in lung and esophageal cancer protein 1 isoform X2 [Ambystoma mexicanum]|uniref:deleted in lung and esophageal cancer protein 1 isoform X2 n=1 Tax=Ambystoma mexicanum TaxID=8296 RepID=UPI0037E7B677